MNGCIWKATVFIVIASLAAYRSAARDEPTDVRAKLAAIALHDAKDFPDYVARAHRLELLIPEMEAFYRQSGAELERLRRKYQSRPGLIELADVIQRLNERDEFGLQLLKEEVRLAFRLQRLPAGKQQDFFNTMIAPLQQVEENVVTEEVEMASSAIDRGLPLPKDIVESLKARERRR